MSKLKINYKFLSTYRSTIVLLDDVYFYTGCLACIIVFIKQMRLIDILIVFFLVYSFTTWLVVNTVTDVIIVLIFITAIFSFSIYIYYKKHDTIIINDLLDTIYSLSIEVVDLMSFIYSKRRYELDALIGVFGYSLVYAAHIPSIYDIETATTEDTDCILKYVCASVVANAISEDEDEDEVDDAEVIDHEIQYIGDCEDWSELGVAFDESFFESLEFRAWHIVPVWSIEEENMVYTWDDGINVLSEQDEDYKDLSFYDYGPDEHGEVEWKEFIRKSFPGMMGHLEHFYTLEYIDCAYVYERNLYLASHVAFTWPTDIDHHIYSPEFKEYCQTEVRLHVEYYNDWHNYKKLIKSGIRPKEDVFAIRHI